MLTRQIERVVVLLTARVPIIYRIVEVDEHWWSQAAAVVLCHPWISVPFVSCAPLGRLKNLLNGMRLIVHGHDVGHESNHFEHVATKAKEGSSGQEAGELNRYLLATIIRQ
jgi:hypothetical protein